MNEKFMRAAIKQAIEGSKKDEVPVGCVLVKDGKIIARGQNRKETFNNAVLHAEIVAINKATKKLKNWYLEGVTAYVTLEPCPMCVGAFINSRIEKIIFGAFDYKSGALGSVINLAKTGLFNHNIIVEGGLLKEECGLLLSEFFKQKRGKRI